MNEESDLKPNSVSAETLYSWRALEFNRTPNRSVFWYIGAGIIWLGLIGYAVYLGDWIRLAMAVLLGIVIWLVIRMKPREFELAITQTGLLVGNKEYSYERFKSFGVVGTDGENRLVVLPIQRFGQGLSLQLGGADVERVRALLGQFLPEESREEDLIDRMNKFFRL